MEGNFAVSKQSCIESPYLTSTPNGDGIMFHLSVSVCVCVRAVRAHRVEGNYNWSTGVTSTTRV